jgi:TrmH family RNA methyltransferase
MIESLTNTKIKYAVKLKQKKYRNEYNQFLIEGEHLIIEAQKSDLIDTIFYTSGDYSVNAYQVSNQVFSKISELGNDHGVIAICNKPKNLPISKKILLLDGVQDPGNLGTLIRTAAAFGFKTIIAENSVDYYNEKVIRSSQGALFYVNLIEDSIIDFVRNNGDYHVFGTDVLNGKDIRNTSFKYDKLAIVLGNEGSGVRPIVKDIVKENIYIPMSETESLNVAIAGAIIMYETTKE